MPVTPILEARALEKSFDGVRALRGVSFDVRAGEVHALVGENGAGKSTLIRALTGAIHPDRGTITVDRQSFRALDPAKARLLGIVPIYQQPALFPDLTVAENIELSRGAPHPLSRVSRGDARAKAQLILERIGAVIDPQEPAGGLSMARQQLLEIAKAVDANARILILDEPTASLGENDKDRLFTIIRTLRAAGAAIIYISHRLEEIFSLSDRVTVLRDGESVATQPTSELDSATLVRLMVGREMKTLFPERIPPKAAKVLEVRGVRGVDFDIAAGEILGLAGLVGSGRTRLAEALFGLSPDPRGEIRIDGRPLKILSSRDAVHHGIAYVPEDRRRYGVVMEMSISQNITLADLRAISKYGVIRFRREREIAGEYLRRLNTKAPSVDTLVRFLSGGNQQKVALSRWLLTTPRVLILDEPAQGIDVGAKAEVYSIISSLAADGLAILLISSDLPEIVGLSDRVAVMRHGHIEMILNRSEAAPERIMHIALGQLGGQP